MALSGAGIHREALKHSDRRTTAFEGMRRSLELTDGVLARKSVTVSFPSGLFSTPAKSLGSSIYLYPDMIHDVTSYKGMANLLGLNYHELAHVIYSPAKLDFFPGNHRASFKEAYRVLEESRIETLLVGRYPSIRKNLTVSVMQFVARENKKHPETFLLTHGRRYLPKKIRAAIRSVFLKAFGAEATRKLAALIDEYRFMSFPDRKSRERGTEIINEFAAWMSNLGLTPPHAHGDGAGTMTEEGTWGDDAKRKEQASEDAEKSRQREEEDEEDEPGDVPGTDSPAERGEEDDPDGEDGDGGRQDQEDEDEDSDHDDGPASEVRVIDDVRDESDPEKLSSRAGAGEDESAPLTQKELQESLEEALTEVLRDEGVQEDVGRLRDAMDDYAAQCSLLDPDEAKYRKVPVTAEMVRRSEGVADRLAELWAQIDSGWSYGVSEGSRIDMNRVFGARTPEELESVYVSWDPGRQESSGLEVVVLGDASGSMSDYNSFVAQTGMRRCEFASQNVWEVRSALAQVDAKVTVLTFQTTCKTLYSREEEADPGHYHDFRSSGGTNPLEAIKEARRILSVSEMTHKLLLVFTDGGWSYHDEIPESLDSMTDVTKVAALIRGGAGNYYGGEWTFSMQDRFDLVEETNGDVFDIMARAVVQMMERNVL